MPGPDVIHECPICSKKVAVGSLLSGNTFGAKFYSDGKRIAPMLPEFPQITKCPDCGNIFWLDENSEIKLSQEENIESARFLNVYEYLEAIENKNYSSSTNELFLRTRVWWGFNDRVRNGEDIFQKENDEAIYEENILRLIELQEQEREMLSSIKKSMGEEAINALKKIDGVEVDFQVLMSLTELYRNIGNFDTSKEILAIAAKDSGQTPLIKIFEQKTEEKNKLVFNLN